MVRRLTDPRRRLAIAELSAARLLAADSGVDLDPAAATTDRKMPMPILLLRGPAGVEWRLRAPAPQLTAWLAALRCLAQVVPSPTACLTVLEKQCIRIKNNTARSQGPLLALALRRLGLACPTTPDPHLGLDHEPDPTRFWQPAGQVADGLGSGSGWESRAGAWPGDETAPQRCAPLLAPPSRHAA